MDFMELPWWMRLSFGAVVMGSIYGAVAIERTERKVNEILYILRSQQRDDDDD